jgi:DNA-binding HxlR family transcriptional regulator
MTPVTGSGLAAALERVGDRWSLLIVETLLDGPRRFNDLGTAVSGIAPNILTDRLRRLEKAGVIVGQRYSERPVRLAYSLTADGQELAGVLRLLAAWGSGVDSDGLRHLVCGTALEARWWCPTCSEAVQEDQASNLRYA